MITQIKTLPNRYPENTILDSRETRHLKIPGGIKTLCAGGYIRLPKNIRKIAISESFGNANIDRYFLEIESKKLIPIYMKIYSEFESNVLIFKNGVTLARQILAPTKVNETSIFLKDELFHHVVTELERVEPCIAEEIKDYTDVQGSSTMLISNDTNLGRESDVYYCSYRSPDSLETLVVNDTVNEDPAASKSGYPWNLINSTSEDVKWSLIDVQPSKIASHLHDLAIQVNLHISPQRLSHPLFLALDEQFLPYLGESYEPLAYDPISKLSITQSELDMKLFTRCKSIRLFSNHDCYIKINNLQCNEVERITTFTSTLLEICVAIHQYPIHEFYFRYILPTCKKQGTVQYSGELVKNHISREELNFFMQVTLPEMLRKWDRSINEITIIKNGDEELLIEICSDKQRKRYYVDLFMTTLLSQSVLQITN